MELTGDDHLGFVGANADQIVDEIHQFLTGSRVSDKSERTLATVMFTDIVGSTETVERLGDQRWADILAEHDRLTRNEISRFQGRAIKSLGDGFLATFDAPGRAVKCAMAIAVAVQSLGINLRAGLHTGEVELGEDDVSGLAVHIASRIADEAGANDVYTSRTVRDLTAGSGIQFEKIGTQNLAGLEEPMDVYASSTSG